MAADADPRSARHAIPSPVLAAVGVVALVALAFSQARGASPAPPGPQGTCATVAGRDCTVYADSPHLAYSRTGQPVVEATAHVGACRGGDVSGLTFTTRLQSCTQMSYGCLWRTVAGRTHDVRGKDTGLYDEQQLISLRTSQTCVAGRYRLLGEAAVQVSGSRGTATDVSHAVDVTCSR